MSMTIRDYRRGGFEVDVRTTAPDGAKVRVRRKAPVKGKSGAQRWGAALERDVLLNLTTPAPPPELDVPTLAEFAPRFIEGHARANRQKASGIDSKERALRVHLLPRFGERKLNQIHNEDIQHLKADLAKRAASTVNNVLTCLNVLLQVAVEWNVIKEMPCKIKLLKVVRGPARFYDFSQYARLVDAAAKVDPRALIMVLLGGDAGLRRGEMLALRLDDLDFRQRMVNVSRSIWKGVEDYPKGARGRPVNMTDALYNALRANRHLRSGRVLCADDGSDVTAKMLRRWMAAAQKRAGLPATGGVHILRHTFCSHLAMRGAPAKAIQELAGHASLSTTMQYMHLSPSARVSAIRLLDTRRSEPQDGEDDDVKAG